MECRFPTCNRENREKIDGAGVCLVCKEGFVTSSCGKFCIDPDTWENDLVWPEDPEPGTPTSVVSKENLECTYLQRKVFKMGLWVCTKCPLYTKADGELACKGDPCSANQI